MNGNDITPKRLLAFGLSTLINIMTSAFGVSVGAVIGALLIGGLIGGFLVRATTELANEPAQNHLLDF
jgi:hypothetical protein